MNNVYIVFQSTVFFRFSDLVACISQVACLTSQATRCLRQLGRRYAAPVLSTLRAGFSFSFAHPLLFLVLKKLQ